jgi:lysophospholipase L1-like esterase
MGEPMIAKILGRTFLIGFTLLLTIVFVEIASRYALPHWAPVSGDRYFWDYDETLGWSHPPNRAGVFAYQDFSVEVQINSAGLRDFEYPLERVPGKSRILLLGDSTTWGFGVEQDETFGSLLEQLRPDWEVINAGVSGYGTDQEFLYYKSKGAAYKPDVVLLSFSGNDPENSFHPVQYWHNKPVFRLNGESLELTNVPVPPESLTQKLANYIAQNTYFLRTASHMFLQYRNGAGKANSFQVGSQEDASAPGEEAADSEAEQPDPLKLAKEDLVIRIILELDQEVRANGARLVVVGSSIGGSPSKDLFKDPRFVAADIPFHSLKGSFRGATEPVTFEHDPHWTAHGHTLVANSIEQFLIEQGVF